MSADEELAGGRRSSRKGGVSPRAQATTGAQPTWSDPELESDDGVLRAAIVAVAITKGSAEPWTSMAPCRPPLGKAGCGGTLDVWLQEVPRAVGWRCRGCGASGTITELTMGKLPPFEIRDEVPGLVRVTLPADEFEALQSCETLDYVQKSFILTASPKADGSVEIAGDKVDMEALADSVIDGVMRVRGDRLLALGELADRILRALS